MDIVFGIIGIFTGTIATIISILSYNHNKIEAVTAYFAYDKDLNFLKGREIVYNLEDNYIVTKDSELSQNVSFVMNTFHSWGLLVKHRQLPLWVFYDKKYGITSSGITVIRTYRKLIPTIRHYRNFNVKYAEYYEWLYNQILNKCTEQEKAEIINKI